MAHREASWSAIRQVGAVPYRRCGGDLEVLLVTNTSRSRWIVPKGQLEPGLTPVESAAAEAWEEAGVVGEMGRRIIATYAYRKCGQRYFVDLYPLLVCEVVDVWPEMARRQRRWLTRDEAMRRIEIRGLRRGIDALHELVVRRRVA